MLHCLACRRFSGDLRGIRRTLTRTFEALPTGAAPGDDVAIGVGQGDYGVIKGCLNVRLPTRNRLAFTPPGLARWFLFVSGAFCHTYAIPLRRYFLAVALFLPATVLFGPRRVRALVRVRCPRTGRLRRWRIPR